MKVSSTVRGTPARHLAISWVQQVAAGCTMHTTNPPPFSSGIDACGRRLAEEIRDLVAQHPEATHLSLLGHSMGGLIARYAAGVLYDPATRRMAGLQPG